MSFCIDCDEWFDDDGDDWKVRCLDCWRERKESQATRRRSDDAELTRLRLENSRLRRALARLEDRKAALPEDFRTHLPRLLLLCHPDRHANSQAANLATAWLLEQRRFLQ